jgi:hypothetical protein
MVSFATPFMDQTAECTEARRRAYLRDEFADSILPFCANCCMGTHVLNGQATYHHNPLGAAQMAYAYADAMLAARGAK